MSTPVTDNPFAVLTLIAAPAVFTNASSVLALGTGNRLARVVDRTRVTWECSSCASTRVRSTTRARRLPVPSARTEDALVKTAGAAIRVSTANGFSVAGKVMTETVCSFDGKTQSLAADLRREARISFLLASSH